MELSEFAVEFLEGALITVEDEGISQEDAITNDILEYIIDSGEVIAGETCHYKIKGMKVNAWNYDDENESIDLFVTIFKGEQRLTKVSDREVQEAFLKAEHFFWSARDGKLVGKVEESEAAVFDLVQITEQTKDAVTNLRIFVLTNGQASADIVPETKEQTGVFIDFQLWDIERVYQQYLIRSGKQKIEIDFVSDFDHKLNCLQMNKVSDRVDVYLAIIPGTILASIYNKYKQGLLEKNVRTFLQFKARVNKKIRETIISEPDMFLAYNNGISTTAERVNVVYEENIPYITRIENWQVVNGGQTTASIFTAAAEKGVDLSKVFVQMKISVVLLQEETEKVIEKISRYANTQTIIRESDFSSNDDYHNKIQDFSRSEWVPARTGGKATHKWYYERTRGQFLDERSRLSVKDSKLFEREYPRSQKFTKTDLAKYEMSWWQQPFEVSKGAEKNFKSFSLLISKIGHISSAYYHDLIAKAILFKEIDRLVAAKKLGGYKANIVAYVIALLAYKTNSKLDLNDIWEKQGISEALNNSIDSMINIVWKQINSPAKKGGNIGEWCKSPECWLTLKDETIDTGGLIIKASKEESKMDLKAVSLSPQEVMMIEEAGLIDAEVWFSLSKWAKVNNYFTPFDRKFAYNMGVLASRRKTLSPKQAKNALRIIKQAKEEGFS
ncbi:MAG: AIPR family protein [Cyclobacteriaceae bacterium]|nr:AIPR family protein [Cyclobacteriaceae bacterium]